jgi:hypothetical protein
MDKKLMRARMKEATQKREKRITSPLIQRAGSSSVQGVQCGDQVRSSLGSSFGFSIA